MYLSILLGAEAQVEEMNVELDLNVEPAEVVDEVLGEHLPCHHKKGTLTAVCWLLLV
jgi:hypothetical protein